MPLKIVRCGLEFDSYPEYREEMKKVADGEKVILIVPDQYSYMAEKRMSEDFLGTGLNNKYVYTFRQMKRTFLNLNNRRYLGGSGKNMLLKSVVQNVIDEESVFFRSRNGAGFLENLGALISEFKRYLITPQDLYKESEKTENKVLKNKIKSIGAIYRGFEEALKNGNFLDEEDDFSRLASALRENEYFKNSHIWIDQFFDFSPQHIKVLAEILKSGAEITVYLQAKADGEVFKNSLYEYVEKTVDVFKALCKKEGIEYKETKSGIKKSRKEAISAFSENFERINYKYQNQAPEIKIFQAKEKYGEVLHTALKISDLVREENYKFSDIAVVTGDLEEYISFIEPVFYEYKIPYFSDYKVSMAENPVAVLITSLFDILYNNSFSRDSVMRYLRTGFIVSDNDADLIENHILKRGIKGNMWNNSKYWTVNEKKVFEDVTGTRIKSRENTYLDDLRKTVISPILKFSESTKTTKTVKEMTEALFQFVNDINLYDKLTDMIDRLNNDGRENEAFRFLQVWDLFVDISDQVVTALAEKEVSREEFYEILISGMAGCEINIIPSVTDGVLVSSASRGVKNEVKALFVLGATKNAFPSIGTDEGMLLDNEREQISLDIAPSRENMGIASEFKAVSLLSSPQELLSISYPLTDIGGILVEPSQMVLDILDMFPYLDKETDVSENDEILYISSPEATIHKLLLKMADDKKLNPLWEEVKKWYEKNGGFEEKLRLIDIVSEFKKTSAKLSPENARALYEDYTNYSISRIEKYFECPFGYFLNNGLKLKEREEWKIGSTDVGDILHWAVSEYCKIIDGDDFDKRKENWQNLTEQKSEEIISDIIKRANEAIEFPEYDTGKTKNMLQRVEKALKKSVRVINISMKNSKYIGAGYETEFSEKEIRNADGTVKIKGIIDRIDIFEDKETGKAYIRIIDYKSGQKGYSLERILNRVDLQLAVYAIASMDMYKNKVFSGFSGELEPVVKGIFYDKINKNLVECSYTEGDFADEAWLNESKLDGVIFTEEIGKGKSAYLDTVDAENMDCEITTSGKSRYLKAEKKEKGQGLNKRKSSAKSDAEKDAILRLVKNSLVDADLKIKSGDITVSPYKYASQTESACKYCPYSVICAPDREKSPCKKRERTEKEILSEIMGGESL